MDGHGIKGKNYSSSVPPITYLSMIVSPHEPLRKRARRMHVPFFFKVFLTSSTETEPAPNDAKATLKGADSLVIDLKVIAICITQSFGVEVFGQLVS